MRDTRLEEFKRIEHLLYGINYEVWFNLYGPADPELGLTDTLKSLISKDCEISGVVPSTPKNKSGHPQFQFQINKKQIDTLNLK
ncbi:hypothetical protein [Aliikangiella sp. IMCC44359]|uniref:hypothetical protein n=1 Tax=Aliikangiella sp. IMCC44359 TaxID=3459125 RepID=UPI00403B34C3